MTLEEAREFFIEDRYAMVTTGIKIDDIGEGYSVVSLDVDERHLAAGNHVMGGAIYTMGDFAFAVASNTPESLTMTTSSSITYLGQPKDRHLIAKCQCIKNGRRTCYYETTVTDSLGNLVAKISSNGMHLS